MQTTAHRNAMYIRVFPKGFPLTCSESGEVHSLPWEVHAYFDPSLPEVLASSRAAPPQSEDVLELDDGQEPWSRLYSGAVAGIPVRVLADTGAYVGNLMSSGLAQRCGLSMTPRESTTTLKMGNDSESQVIGMCVAKLQVQGYYETTEFLVKLLAGEFDIVLGNHFLRKRHALMDLEHNTMRVRKGNVTYLLHSLASTGNVDCSFVDGGSYTEVPRPKGPILCSAKLAARDKIAKCRSFYVLVSASEKAK